MLRGAERARGHWAHLSASWGSAAWTARPAEAACSSRPAARAAAAARTALASRNRLLRRGSSAGATRRSSGEPVRTRRESRRAIRAGGWCCRECGRLRGSRLVAVATNDRVTREALGLLPGESLSVQRHARELLIPHSEADGDHDRGRARRGPAARIRAPARPTLAHVPCYRISRPLRDTRRRVWVATAGLPDPCGVARPGLAPIESAGLAAFHRDRSTLVAARRGRGRGAGRGSGGNGGGRAAARAAAKAAARAAEQQQDGGRLHERLRNPRSPVVLAVAARKRRSAERPDQTVAGPRWRKQVEKTCAAACEHLPPWARCEDQPKGWDFCAE